MQDIGHLRQVTGQKRYGTKGVEFFRGVPVRTLLMGFPGGLGRPIA